MRSSANNSSCANAREGGEGTTHMAPRFFPSPPSLGLQFLLSFLLSFATARAQVPMSAPSELLGGERFANWTGLAPAADGAAALPTTGAATFRYPDGPRGFYKHGFRTFNDGAADWLGCWGVQFDVKLPSAGDVLD